MMLNSACLWVAPRSHMSLRMSPVVVAFIPLKSAVLTRVIAQTHKMAAKWHRTFKYFIFVTHFKGCE